MFYMVTSWKTVKSIEVVLVNVLRWQLVLIVIKYLKERGGYSPKIMITYRHIRILTAVLIFIFASFTDSTFYPGPHFHIKRECGTVQLRKIITETRADGSDTPQEVDIPTIFVKFPTGEEQLEVGIDVYEKLKLKSSYYRYSTVENELPTLHRILNMLCLICTVWFIIEVIRGFGKLMSI